MCLVADSSVVDSSLFGFVMKEGMTNELPPFNPPVLSPFTSLAQQVELHPSGHCQAGAGMSMSQLAFVRAPLPLAADLPKLLKFFRAPLSSFPSPRRSPATVPPTTGPGAWGGEGGGGGGEGEEGRRGGGGRGCRA
jgi:hypothetical protein